MADQIDVHAVRSHVRGLVRPAWVVGSAVAASAVLRPLRDEQAVRCGADAVTGLFIATFVVLVLVTAVGASAARRTSHPDATPAPMHVTIVAITLLLAWLASDGAGQSLAGAAFVVGHGVSTVLAIGMAWQSVTGRGETLGHGRMVGAAAVGAGVGSIVGPLMAAVLVAGVGPQRLVPVAALLLGAATFSARNRANAGPIDVPRSRAEPLREASGTEPTVRRVAVLVGGWSAISTVIYFVQISIAGEQLVDPTARVQWFAALDLTSNATALLIQILTMRWTARRTRLSAALTIGPALAAGGFIAIWTCQDLGVLAVVSVIGRAGGTALFRPAREAMLASGSRPIASHTRCTIDGIVYRAADAATAASIGVISGGTPSVGQLALFGTTAAIALAAAGSRIGRSYDEQHIDQSTVATSVRAVACRERIDPRLPGGARCRGASLDYSTNSIDGRKAADRGPRHLADVRRRSRRPRSDS